MPHICDRFGSWFQIRNYSIQFLVIGHMKSKRKSFLGEFEEIPNFEPLVEKIMKIKPDCPDGDSKIIERTLNGKRMLFVRVIFSAKRKVSNPFFLH